MPCNISVFLKVRDNKLDITVINRSNDLYLGVPYNAFVFYLLQKYIANEIGIEVGVQRHFTDSLHLYEKDFNNVQNILDSNNTNNISISTKRLQKFNLDRYININHKNILDFNFDNVHNVEIKNFFKSYQVYKESSNFQKAINLLPINILGFIAYQWYRNKKAFSTELKINEYEEIINTLFPK